MSTQEKVSTTRQCLQVHAEVVNMLEGLEEAEEAQYFEDNPKIIPLFEVNILQARTPPHIEEEANKEGV